MPVAPTVPPVNKQAPVTAPLASQATTSIRTTSALLAILLQTQATIFLVSTVRLVHQTAFDATHLPAFVVTAAHSTALCLTVVASTTMDMEYSDLLEPEPLRLFTITMPARTVCQAASIVLWTTRA